MHARMLAAVVAVTGLLGGAAAAVGPVSSDRRTAVVVASAPHSPGAPASALSPLTPGGPDPVTGAAAATPTTTIRSGPGPAASGRSAGKPAPVPAPAANHGNPGANATSAVTPSAPGPAAPGTYRYHQTSSPAVAAAEGTLIVAPAQPDGTQLWTRKLGGSVAPTTTVMLFDGAGTFMLSPSGQLAGTGGSCAFATPLPMVPWPASTGRAFSGQATCSGAVQTMTVACQIDQAGTVSLDGATIQVFRVVTTLVMKGSYNGGPISVVQTDTNWYSPDLRVPVKTQTHVQGRVIGLPVTIDSTGVLESAKPS